MKYCLTCQTEGHFDDENIFWCENKKCRDYNMGVTERTDEIRAIVDFVKQHFVDRKEQAVYISQQHLEKAEQALAFQLLDNKENPIESYITKMSNNHIPWPDIRQFHQVKKDVGWKAQYTGLEDAEGTPIMDRTAIMPLLEFEGTVKVHGSNAAIQLHKDGHIVCQSRERIITPLQDNAGFARFIHDIPVEFWDQYKVHFPENWEVVTIFGEWAGPGIQKGVAVGNLSHKTFFIFGAKSGEGEDTEWLDVRDWKGDADKHIHNIYEFPTFKLFINFEEPETMINTMNDITLAVEKECPVGKAFFVINEDVVAYKNGNKYDFSLEMPDIIRQELNQLMLRINKDKIGFNIRTIE
jgi:hypothetical protein